MQTIQELLNAAQQHFHLGQFEQAEQCYRLILQSQPDNPIALHSLGLIDYQKGNTGNAIHHIKNALSVDPSYAGANYDLGIIFENQGDLDSALQQYENVALTDPAYAEAYLGTARVLQKQGRLNEAIVQHKKVIALAPFHEPSLQSLGDLFSRQGNLAEAVRFYEKAIAVNPSNLSALNNLGIALRGQGVKTEASAAFRSIISINPAAGSAYFNLTQIEPSLDTTEVQNIHHQLERGDLPKDDRMFLHYSLGLVYNKAKSYDQAFLHTSQGNTLQRRKITYSSESESALLNSVAESFNQSYFNDRFGTKETDSESPVFIIGMPRSGSTLVEQIIATHPMAHGGGETLLLDNLLAGVVDRDSVFQSLAALDNNTSSHLAREYLKQLRSIAPDKKIVTNKKLDNYLFLGVIASMFPGAKIIHCQRNPLDNCLSCFQTWFHTGQYFSYDMKELAEYYLAYQKLMKHWREVLPIEMLEVQYEDLIDNPEAVSRRIISYCDLEWDPQCLLFHENTRNVYTASDLQVRRPVYQSSKERWRHYEKHLSPLINTLARKTVSL
ncbi:MAG: sulfotransferase [Endozoicomonas sp.]